ncbi:AAA family ATPase [Micromonospora sp. DR5-3]|uniref:AAA family ATPase n=1 Tax=unclassified Micromonospora TaxID=2617518 RepID=UPI001CA38511|nr:MULTISPECIES: AAA family ATPase [unclassified Micromonospora]MCW3814365.1 AAA family ATPase [Micromonospora sp. DR5-3]
MATGEVVPVLWLCGPPGVGKTAVGWEIYTELIRSGVRTGYVDVDQLGMCYPEPAGDPGRHRMKARNLNAVIAGYRAAGARCVVVSGVVDARPGVHRDELTQVALTVCRLRADEEQLAQRFVGRQGHDGGLAQALREAVQLDAGAVAEVCVDTTGLTVADVARRVRDRLNGWPVLSDPQRPLSAAEPVDGHPVGDGAGAGVDRGGRVLWLCGATGVGKSTIGFQVYLKVLGAGLTAAYIDLDQIGFCGPVPAGHRLKARNLAALWRTYRDAGAQALVMVGPAEDEATLGGYGDALPASTVTVCRLHAGRDTLTSRIMLRGQGRGSWPQPGDPLVGKPAAHLLSVADQAAHEAEALERAAIGHRIDTDGRTIAELTDMVVARTGWLGQLP